MSDTRTSSLPRLAALGAVALLTLSACSLVPEYERPAAPIASHWPVGGATEADTKGAAAADLRWQNFVQDDQLRKVVQLALDHNRDLRIAVQNIEQARAQYRIRQADRLPTVAAEATGTRSQPTPTGTPSVSSSYTVGLGVSAWELDFFGRVAALEDVALADFLATTEARKSAQISLVASVMTTWLQLKTDTELLALTERTLATREQSLELIQLRFDNGASSALDLRQAESLVASAKATSAEQKRQRMQDINLLTLLVGTQVPDALIPELPDTSVAEAPTDLAQPTATVAPAADLPDFAQVPAGLPSDLLLRRPDIHAAEQQLIGANANIGAARANFFPRITLTGSLGRASHDLDGLFGSGGSKAWSFGPSITLPIFDAERNRAGLESARAGREIAVAQYEKTIQTAFREVSDALAGRATLGDQLNALQEQVAADRDRFRLADLRYRNGVASFLDLLDAQRSLFAVEQALAQVQLAQRANEVALYKSLGGGWSDGDTPPVAGGTAR
ncbi:MAG: efflux transporter outer membrane subunit [Ottowia sp.]|nr:efflux transporter outer membrane subunit [Ottowia sp.]